MEIGISYYFGYNDIKSPKETFELIKNAGFKVIMSNADNKLKVQNGSFRKQMRYMKEYGIKPSSLHMRYKNPDLPYFWKNSKIGDKLEKNIIKDLKIANKYGFNSVVVHLYGEYSKIGEDRLYRLLKKARYYNVPLAIENIDASIELFEKVMSIKDDYLKFCYDSGHNNVFHKGYDFLEKYGDRLIALHLHDNDGNSDQHTLNKYGTINWDDIAKKLAKCPEVNIDYELLQYKKYNELSKEEVLKECYKQGEKLKKLIEEYRKKAQ